MNKYPNVKVEISGHTDNKGDKVYNQKLSEDRAKIVVARLIEKGISPSRMKAKGYGELKPVKSNTLPNGSDDPDGRQQNRRVEFKIIAIK